jgi:hypothetical protein
MADADEIVRLRRINAELVDALRRINRITSPGSRTLDDFIRDMGWACDECRRAIAMSKENTGD